jgi:hypothetical protein
LKNLALLQIILVNLTDMREIYNMNPVETAIGLCATCQNAQRINNRRGSVFYLCKLSEKDARFPKYPRLPVTACDGFEPQVKGKASPRASNPKQ